MNRLSSAQAKYLRGLAHGIKPVVFIGQKGATEAVVRSLREALEAHELVKIRFIDFKEKTRKEAMADIIAREADCRLAGIIGHVGIFYRPHSDPRKRKIVLPRTESDG